MMDKGNQFRYNKPRNKFEMNSQKNLFNPHLKKPMKSKSPPNYENIQNNFIVPSGKNIQNMYSVQPNIYQIPPMYPNKEQNVKNMFKQYQIGQKNFNNFGRPLYRGDNEMSLEDNGLMPTKRINNLPKSRKNNKKWNYDIYMMPKIKNQNISIDNPPTRSMSYIHNNINEENLLEKTGDENNFNINNNIVNLVPKGNNRKKSSNIKNNFMDKNKRFYDMNYGQEKNEDKFNYNIRPNPLIREDLTDNGSDN